MGPISSCALGIVEGKITFPLEWFVIPATREMDDYVVTVTKYLQYISAKDSGLSGNMGYINYPVWKAASVSLPAQRIKRKNWSLLRFLGVFSTNQGALAVIMKGTWQAGGQTYGWPPDGFCQIEVAGLLPPSCSCKRNLWWGWITAGFRPEWRALLLQMDCGSCSHLPGRDFNVLQWCDP